MSTPNPAPLRVAECHACQQLFAVYATEGAVACPSCGTPVEIATLETALLGVAEPIEVRIEAPPEPAPAAVPAADEVSEEPVTLAPPSVEEPTAADKPPTVAEWLMRNDEPAESAATESLKSDPPAETTAKPTLSESLGWNESLPGFDPPEPEPETERPSLPIAEENPQSIDSFELSPAAAELPQPPEDEFRFDLGATPLSETSTEIETSQPSELKWEGGESETESRRGGWFKPLASLAALLLVAGLTGAYLLRGGDFTPLAEANRGGRLIQEPKDDGLTPPDPYAAIGTIASTDAPETTVPPPEPTQEPPVADSLPIRDPATRPVGYEAPPSDPRSNPPAGTPPLEELPPARATPEPAVNRYASLDGGSLDALPPADAPPAQEPLPITPVSQEVGLIGVPPTTVDQLVAATADAAPSGQAFVEHDLADREQAPVLGQHYARLSYLAQTLTLLDPAEQGPQHASAEMEAVDVFSKLFRGARGRSQALQIAGPWINWRDRPYGGVFFSGDPIGVSRAGAVSRCDFKVGDQTIPVIMPKELDVQRLLVTRAKELGVLGVIVEEPQKWIAGYEGDAQRVIWARKTIPLRSPVEL